MSHRVSPRAEAELDGIWYYIARESGSMDVADRFVDSLASTFYPLASNPHIGRRRKEDLRPACVAFPSATISFCTASTQSDVLILHVVRGSRNIEALFER